MEKEYRRCQVLFQYEIHGVDNAEEKYDEGKYSELFFNIFLSVFLE